MSGVFGYDNKACRARTVGVCSACKEPIEIGDTIFFEQSNGKWIRVHLRCTAGDSSCYKTWDDLRLGS